MFSIEIEIAAADDRDLLIADLWEQGSCGISEPEGHAIRAFFEDPVNRAALLARFPGAVLREEENHDWVQSSRDLLQPMEVGRKFFLAPEWRDDPTPPGRLRISINPGMAFGTGVHETTRLCLEALEDYVTPGADLLDVGTGSGILRRAAKLLGAGKTYGCDIDPVAVRIAGEAFVGSADAAASGAVDIVTANINAEAVIGLASDLLRVLRPGGLLLASGFELHEIDLVQAALPPAAEVRRKGNWALIATRRPK